MVKLSLGYEVLRCGKEKFYEITWEDFHILNNLKVILIPTIVGVFPLGNTFYVIIGDAQNIQKKPHYAIKLGSYEDVSGSLIHHSNENTIDIWEKLAFKKEETK